MEKNYRTGRLVLDTLSLADADFIFELVNSAGWKKFIGDRNVHNTEDAMAYIEKILSNTAIHYRVVRLAVTGTPVGLVTLIQRDYLEHPDIGFAFLPQYAKNGYAFEASHAVLHDVCSPGKWQTVLATTIPDNSSSIHLLKKLGFTFRNEIKTGTDTLHVYAVTAGKLHKQQ